jgi:hypothetical protein
MRIEELRLLVREGIRDYSRSQQLDEAVTPSIEEIQGLVWDQYLILSGQTAITGDPSGDPAPEEPTPEEPTPEESEEEPELPPAPDSPPEQVKRLGLARMDDDGTKIYIATRRKKDLRDKERELMTKAQSNAISGKTSDPSTDELDKEFKKARRALNPQDASYKDIEKAIRGKSRKEPEPYFTVDASIYNDSAKALKAAGVLKTARVTKGLKATIDTATKGLLNQFVKGDRKQTVRQTAVRIRNAFKKNNYELNQEALQALIKVFQTYGLTREGDLQLENLRDIVKEELKIELNRLKKKKFLKRILTFKDGSSKI